MPNDDHMGLMLPDAPFLRALADVMGRGLLPDYPAYSEETQLRSIADRLDRKARPEQVTFKEGDGSHLWVDDDGGEVCSVCKEDEDSYRDGPCSGPPGSTLPAKRVEFLVERLELGTGIPTDARETWDALCELLEDLRRLAHKSGRGSDR